MKRITLLLMLGLLAAFQAPAQSQSKPSLPITFSAFSISPGTFLDSWHLPTLPALLSAGAGLQVGTEFYYRNRPASQLFQTLSLSAYHQYGVETGLMASSALGYRKYLGPVSLEAQLGAGLLRTRSIPAYTEQTPSGGYRSAHAAKQAIVPTIGLGLGYRVNWRTAFFLRYDLTVQPQFDHPRFGIRQLRQLHLGGRFNLRP